MKRNIKPTKAELAAFIDEHSWHNQMSRANGLDSFSNYSGPDHGHAVVVVGMNRDSEVLDISNFESALERLGGESDTVQILWMGHWACGWIRLLVVNPQDRKALVEAYKIKCELREYPVLDESDFSEREYESFSDYAESAKEDLAKALCIHLGLSNELAKSKEMLDVAYYLNLECQYYAGSDSCINLYEMREPDQRDWERVLSCLDALTYSQNLDSNEAFQFICAALNVEMKGA